MGSRRVSRKTCYFDEYIKMKKNMFYVKKMGKRDPPKNALDFEGVPKSPFFNINQHKTRKSGVPEGVPEKHDILMRNQCGKVTFQEA